MIRIKDTVYLHLTTYGDNTEIYLCKGIVLRIASGKCKVVITALNPKSITSNKSGTTALTKYVGTKINRRFNQLSKSPPSWVRSKVDESWIRIGPTRLQEILNRNNKLQKNTKQQRTRK